jgi:hypothetical protein
MSSATHFGSGKDFFVDCESGFEIFTGMNAEGTGNLDADFFASRVFQYLKE